MDCLGHRNPYIVGDWVGDCESIHSYLVDKFYMSGVADIMFKNIDYIYDKTASELGRNLLDGFSAR